MPDRRWFYRAVAVVKRLPVTYNSSLILSFTASHRRCLQPKYLSVVSTETRPSRNWIGHLPAFARSGDSPQRLSSVKCLIPCDDFG